jgi:hypothetical protein
MADRRSLSRGNFDRGYPGTSGAERTHPYLMRICPKRSCSSGKGTRGNETVRHAVLPSLLLKNGYRLSLDFIVGFTANFLPPTVVDVYVVKFLSMVYRNGVPPEKAFQISAIDLPILKQTGIVYLQMQKDSTDSKISGWQLVRTAEGLPWGLQSGCNDCHSTPGSIKTHFKKGAAAKINLVCMGCKNHATVDRPKWVIPVENLDEEEHWFLLPFPVPLADAEVVFLGQK